MIFRKIPFTIIIPRFKIPVFSIGEKRSRFMLLLYKIIACCR